MGRGKVTKEQNIEIKALLQAGFSQRRAANAVGVSKKCISGVSQTLKANLPLSNAPEQGLRRSPLQLMIEYYSGYVRRIAPNLVNNYQLR